MSAIMSMFESVWFAPHPFGGKMWLRVMVEP
jgi:hypothetical protein